MSTHPPHLEAVSLIALSDTLLAAARSSHSQRAAHTVFGGTGLLRQTAIALLADAELGAHESPPEASLHVLVGKVRLAGQDRHWDLSQGELVPVPPERHSVAALEDSVFLLTVRRDTDVTVSKQQGPQL